MGGDGKGPEDSKQVVLVAAGRFADGEHIDTSAIRLQGGLERSFGVFDGDGLCGAAVEECDGRLGDVTSQGELDGGRLDLCNIRVHDEAPCLALSAGAVQAGPFKSTSDAKLVRLPPRMRPVDETHSCSGV